MNKAIILSAALNDYIRGDSLWRDRVRTKSKFNRVFVGFTEDCPDSVKEVVLDLANEMKEVVGEEDEFGKIEISVQPMSLVTSEIELWDEKSRAEMKAWLTLTRKTREERKKPE